MSALLFLVIIPAVIAFAFGVYVMYSILPDIDDRLNYYYSSPDTRRIIVGGGSP